jgi:hypothetical protein
MATSVARFLLFAPIAAVLVVAFLAAVAIESMRSLGRSRPHPENFR